MDTNSILPPGLEQLALKSDPKKTGNELGQSDFLKLMLTQIRNQDPINPSDSTQFLTQLAQIGTVNGISDLQSSFDQLSSSLQSSQALQASTMVGRSVLVPGSAFQLNPAQSMRGAVELEAATGDLAVTISDASGQVVKQLHLGAQAAGTVQFAWDGLDAAGHAAAPGAYQVTARAGIDNEVVTQPTLIQAKVESVTLTQSGDGPLLNLQGLGPVPMNDVKQVM